ncbi:MAG: Gfo/Idh/MocA family oxidoreductase [Bacteroidales bacterium]|nr:Gfo/Idh/MocA family oxidoreductase [Bacteroidales bacterium]
MARKTIRWGMIGTGNVTELKSAPSFNKVENSQLVAVGNRSFEKAKDYAARHGIPEVHEDPFEVIYNPEVDIVYIATPPGSHMEYALETIKAGKPVYIEKPMARTARECRVINEAAEKGGVPVFVAYYRRELEYFKKVKSIIDEGTLGRILHVNLQQFYPARPEDYDRDNLPWRVIPEDSGGGYFHDLGCHALDILFHIFGDPLEVSGKISNVGGMYEPEDSLSASLRLPDDLLLTGSWNFVTPPAFQRDLVEVCGEKGLLSFGIFSFKPITLNTGDHKETIATIQPEHIQMPLIRTIVSEMNGQGRCPSTGRSAEITSEVMDIIRGVYT